jgi:hypothetical protein
VHSAQATYSILYETASINFLGPSQAAFQTSVPYHMSWCRMNMRISLHAGLREAAGVWEGGARGDPGTAHKHRVRWRSKDGAGVLYTALTWTQEAPRSTPDPQPRSLKAPQSRLGRPCSR